MSLQHHTWEQLRFLLLLQEVCVRFQEFQHKLYKYKLYSIHMLPDQLHRKWEPWHQLKQYYVQQLHFQKNKFSHLPLLCNNMIYRILHTVMIFLFHRQALFR